jgi:hypothetical protein
VIAADLLAALGPVLETLRELGVRHYVAGSIASSVHGLPRASVDADVVAELAPRHAGPLVEALGQAYYVPEERVHDAIRRRGSFNLIHLATMVKVDVFVSRDRPFDRRAFERSLATPAEGSVALLVASAEDTVLAKLEWFRSGGETSERQWADVLGILRVATSIDVGYLGRGAAELGVADLLERALKEARQG